MGVSLESRQIFDNLGAYQIVVRGMLPENLTDRLEGMLICHTSLADGESISILTGKLDDQAALNGVLNTIYGLQMTILSVHRL